MGWNFEKKKKIQTSQIRFHEKKNLHIMYCIFLPLIHKSVRFYEKAIFMGEFSVRRIVRGRIVRRQIVL